MLGRTLHEYIFIRACITPLRYPVVPYLALLFACFLGANYTQFPSRWVTTAGVITCMAATELIYALFIWLPYTKRLREPAKHPSPSSPAERLALFERCMATIPDFERYIRMWFLGADMSDIRRDNVREFLLWAFFDMGEDDIKKASARDGENYDVEVEQYVTRSERLLGRPLKPGRGPAKCLRLTIDSVDTKYRSVWWYAIMAFLDHVTHLSLRFYGFQYYAQPRDKAIFPPRLQQTFASRRSSAGNVSYWHRPHRSEGLPVVFLHGIGIGLWPYVRFLAEITSTMRKGHGQTGVIAIEILPVSFRLTDPPLGKDIFLKQLKQIVNHHAWDKFTLVSHSYGSILSTHAMRCPDLQARIPRAVLIDPVSILLHLPDVAYNFTRRKPSTANQWQLWYFASMDPGVAHCLARYFFWRENAIWADELVGCTAGSESAGDERQEARQVTVCLSGLDLIVDSHAVARYLAEGVQAGHPAWLQGEHDRRNVAVPKAGPISGMGYESHRSAGSGIDILWFPDKDHAQVFDSPSAITRIVGAIWGDVGAK
ncbi:hypothetical protein CORC01_00138 [Colletotrichum orchidophilum]|uniref:AB hydrolase-1 domain-containing protein n=1 Tax=Colletotrichum orchidophilum TaxID=1209926 RepID=A0A1G4BTT4_9PEZI|nr:uncharacterized protein CORC01_00138 [Colletotrichum orchidophilum]OHF04667.1 hypothetical protein CORC01_00138 [Colletotrichum orchidophilum]